MATLAAALKALLGLVFGNWKSSLLGWAAGVAVWSAAYFGSGQVPGLGWSLVAAGFAALGSILKDYKPPA